MTWKFRCCLKCYLIWNGNTEKMFYAGKFHCKLQYLHLVNDNIIFVISRNMQYKFIKKNILRR